MTGADLDAVAAAALRLGPGFRLLGSGGLAAALGAHHVPLGPADLAAGTVRLPRTAAAPALTVLSIDGSAGPRLHAGRALSTALGALAAAYPGRPGSYGAEDSLLRIAVALRPRPAASTTAT